MAGKRKRSVDDMSIAELRQVIIEKQRDERKRHSSKGRRWFRNGKNEKSTIAEESTQNQAILVDAGTEYQRSTPRPKRTFFDRVLVGIEVIAVIGLIYIFFNIFSLLKNLNQG